MTDNCADESTARVVEQHDVNTVMLRLLLGPDLSERLKLDAASTGPHFSQRMVTPSFVAPRSGSPRNSGMASSRFSTVSLKMEKSSPAICLLYTSSSGKGGALYVGLRKSFGLRKKEGGINDAIAGEDFSIFNDTVLNLSLIHI